MQDGEQGAIGVEFLDKGHVGREQRVDFGADADAGFVGPEPGHVARGVAAAAEDEEGAVKGFGEGDAGAMGADVEVEAAQTIAAEGIGAALQDDGGGVVGLDARADDVLEELDVGEIVDAVVERDVEGVVGAGVGVDGWTGGVEPAGAGEVGCFVVFMKGEGHDPVGGPKGLLHAIAMMHVNVDVENTWVVEEQLQDRKHDVIDVTEPRGLGLLGMVQAARPVDRDVGLVGGQLASGVERGAGVEGAIAVEAIEDRAVVTHVIRVAAIVGQVRGKAISGGDSGDSCESGG